MNSTASRTGNTLRPVPKDQAQAALHQLPTGQSGPVIHVRSPLSPARREPVHG